jgi:hypothetical protein
MGIKSFHSKWLICGFFAIGFSFSFSAYFLNFWDLADNEKLIVFSACNLFVFSILLLLPDEIFKNISNSFTRFSFLQKIVTLFITLGISLFLFGESLANIPTLNSFLIKILPDESNGSATNEIEILQIGLLGHDGHTFDSITPYDVILNGNWQTNKNSFSISSPGGDSIQYKFYSTDGISLLLQNSPLSGKIEVIWNGKSQIIDLQSDSYDQVIVDFPHYFSFQNLTFFRTFIVSFLIISNFISIFFLIFLFLITKQLFHNLPTLFWKANFAHKVVLLLFSITICFGFIEFSSQAIDILNIYRQSSNSLLSLFGKEGAYFQVYYKISDYFNGYKLIIPNGLILDQKKVSPKSLGEQDLLDLGQLSSINEQDYRSELSSLQVKSILEMKRASIPPSKNVIPHKVEFVFETNDQNNVLCLWWKDETLYFIPLMDGFNCLKGAM